MPWLLSVLCALWVFTAAHGIGPSVALAESAAEPVQNPPALSQQGNAPTTTQKPESEGTDESPPAGQTDESEKVGGRPGDEGTQGQASGQTEVQTLPGGARRGVYQGRLESVNVEDEVVVIAPADREEKVSAQVPEGVPVFIEGRLAGRDELREGQQVRASYEERGGSTRLRWIEVHEAGDLDAPPGVGGAREGVGGPHGGAQGPTSERSTGQGSNSGQGEEQLADAAPRRRATSTGSSTQETGPPPGSPQGSTGIQGDGIPGEQYVGEGPGTGDGTGAEKRKEGYGSSGIAQTEEMMAPDSTPGERGQPGLNEVTGVVVRANVADNELVISQQGRELTLRVPAGATVLVEGRRGTLDSLEEGTPVRASLATQDESPIAVWVETMEHMPGEGEKSDSHPDAPQMKHGDE